MIEDKDCKDMKYFYLINLFYFRAVNLGFKEVDRTEGGIPLSAAETIW